MSEKMKNWDDVENVLNPWKEFLKSNEIPSRHPTYLLKIIMEIRDFLQLKDVKEEFIFGKMMEFTKGMCTDVINPQIVNMRGDLLFKSISRFYERFSFACKIFNVFFSTLNGVYLKNEKNVMVLGKKMGCAVNGKSRDLLYFCLHVFRTNVFVEQKELVHGQILHFIDLDRKRDQVNNDIVKNAVQLFKDMNTDETDYYKELEKSINENCRVFYMKAASDSVNQDSVPEFLRKCDRFYEDEKARVRNYLQDETREVLLKTLDETVLKPYVNFMLGNESSGFNNMVKSNLNEDLKRLFDLLGRIDIALGIQPMADRFCLHIRSVGAQAMLDQKNFSEANLQKLGGKKKKKKKKADAEGAGDDAAAGEEGGEKKKKKKKATSDAGAGDEGTAAAAEANLTKFVDGILDRYRQYELQVNECFSKHVNMYEAMTKAFRLFLNETEEPPMTRLLACYADEYIRAANKHELTNEVRVRFEEISNMLLYLKEKDIFMSTYQLLVSKRLLDLAKAGEYDDIELEFILKLKAKHGNGFTGKLERMMSDLQQSQEIEAGLFKEWVAKTGTVLPFDFDSYLLTYSSWVCLKPVPVTIPSDLSICCDLYTKYYQTLHPQQVLAWDYTRGVVQLSVKVKKRTLEVMTSTVNAMILMKFNNMNPDKTPNRLLVDGGMTLASLSSALGLDKRRDRNLATKTAVMTLSQKRAQLLVIEMETETLGMPDGYEEEDWEKLSFAERKAAQIANDAIIRFNADFVSTQYRINIPCPPPSSEEIIIVDGDTQIERLNILDATIVRIMKSKNTCTLEDLMGLTIESIKLFVPKRIEILRRIEDLIERSYLRRDDERKLDLFHYIS